MNKITIKKYKVNFAKKRIDGIKQIEKSKKILQFLTMASR